MRLASKTLMLLLILAGGIWLAYAIVQRLNVPTKTTRSQTSTAFNPVSVEVTPIQTGLIESYQVFSGSLEATSAIAISPKVSGRITQLHVDIADKVERGQLIAELDNAEYQQAVAQSNATLAVSKATLIEAESQLTITKREVARLEMLSKRGIASESELDKARGDLLTKDAAVAVARAQILKDQSALETATIRLGYTRVTADWADSDQYRVVAERMADVGETVAANTPLLSIVQLNPINAVISVSEANYRFLKPNQKVFIRTDAYRGETFEGHISRIAPVFRTQSRQARVELIIKNDDQRLKPGMFVRASIMINRDENATIVPLASLTTRDDQVGIFLVNQDGKTVKWQPVKTGIQAAERIQIVEPVIQGRVVTLGQQLIKDGSPITISTEQFAKPVTEKAG